MAGKALNAKNLETLGADRLAELVIELCQGSAPLKRQARAALLEASGSEALAAEVRKRLISTKRSKARVGWRKRKALRTDLDQQRALIIDKIAPRDPALALDLAWQFMDLASAIYTRTSDPQAEVAAVFAQACADLGSIATEARPDPKALAKRVSEALLTANRYREFAPLIAAIHPALGKKGLAVLKQAMTDARNGVDPKSYAARRKSEAIRTALLQIADLTGDVDGYLAETGPKARKAPATAADIATRLLAAARPAEALEVLDASDAPRRYALPEFAEARLAALEALGRQDEAQAIRRERFETQFDTGALRAYIARLPEFEDVEAEDAALDRIAAADDTLRALTFLIDWPALDRAAALVMQRREQIDGGAMTVLSRATDALDARYPLAAIALRRLMIEDVLSRARTHSYPDAARYWLECESLDAVTVEYDVLEDHIDFEARMRADHPRRGVFWKMVEGA